MSPIVLEDDRPVRHEWLGREWDGISRAEAMRRLLAKHAQESGPERGAAHWWNVLRWAEWLARDEAAREWGEDTEK